MYDENKYMDANEQRAIINYINEFLEVYHKLVLKAISQCETLEQLKEIEKLTIGKNGLLTVMQKELGKAYKESRLRNDSTTC